MMNGKKLIAVALAVFTVLTLAVSSASADGGGGDPCKKRPCPPPPCKVDCPNPEPTVPPVPPAPEPAPECNPLVEGFHIGRRQAGESKWVFVTVHMHETNPGGLQFAIEYRSTRHDGNARAIDGGILNFDFVETYRVRQWRYVTGGVYVTVEGCDHRNISVEFSA